MLCKFCHVQITEPICVGCGVDNGASFSNALLCVDKQANVENLRRVFVKMHRLLDLREEDSALIDLVNHADTLAQQLQDT